MNAGADAHRSSADMASELVSALAAAGTTVLFGIPGGGSNLDVVGAAERVGLRFVLTHGESAAATMAGVAAELTGAPGACLMTRGPGVASATNGVAQALLDRQPILAVSDCVAEAERDRVSHQRLDQLALMSTVAKASRRFGPDDRGLPAAAIELAATGRPGPVHLDFDPTAAGKAELFTRSGRYAPVPAKSWEEVVRGAHRPVIVAGLGARGRSVVESLARVLADRDIPVLTTYKARGVVDDRSPIAAGIATGAQAEAPLLEAADLIVGIGLDPVELIPAPWPYPAPVVLLGSWPIDDSDYFGDRLAAEVVAEVPALVDALGGFIRSTWPAGEGQRHRARANESIEAAVPVDPAGLTPQEVVTIARTAAPSGTVATVDAGAHMLATVPLWAIEAPGELLISNGLATMGFALPAAIAASVVVPQATVVCFTGDGGLGIALAELETLARLGGKVIIVVFNDATLSLIAIKQASDGHGGPAAVSYEPIDFAAIAAGFGIHAAKIADADDYRRALATALSHDGPSLLDVRVDPTGYPAILAAIRGAAAATS